MAGRDGARRTRDACEVETPHRVSAGAAPPSTNGPSPSVCDERRGPRGSAHAATVARRAGAKRLAQRPEAHRASRPLTARTPWHDRRSQADPHPPSKVRTPQGRAPARGGAAGQPSGRARCAARRPGRTGAGYRPATPATPKHPPLTRNAVAPSPTCPLSEARVAPVLKETLANRAASTSACSANFLGWVIRNCNRFCSFHRTAGRFSR